MKGRERGLAVAVGVLGVAALIAPVAAQPLTADQAVALALRNSSQIIGADAALDDARSAQYSALAGVLPSVTLSASRRGSWSEGNTGSQVFAGIVFPTDRNDVESYTTTPSVSGSWNVLNLSSLAGLSSARTGLRAAHQRHRATTNDVAYDTRRTFYEVVKAVKSAEVNAQALKLARDDERRVRALFEVGSVSKSDVLQAQVRTAQSELDSIVSTNRVLTQRIALSDRLGVPEAEMPAVDTTLAVATGVTAWDPAAVLEEASRNRPDLMAVEAELAAARMGLRSANLGRLPYVSVSGGASFDPRTSFTQTLFENMGAPLPAPVKVSGRNETDLSYNATLAVNWNLFDGMATDARIASARARVMRAESARDQLRRNLDAEVRQTLLAYRESAEGLTVARRALESAEESLKLIQQKYNVGSATILELINAQVSLQRAANDEVTALAALRVAEAAIQRVRGVTP